MTTLRKSKNNKSALKGRLKIGGCVIDGGFTMLSGAATILDVIGTGVVRLHYDPQSVIDDLEALRGDMDKIRKDSVAVMRAEVETLNSLPNVRKRS